MERLAHHIQHELSFSRWKPIRLSTDGPPPTHLFFVVDLLLFGEASCEKLEVVMKYLNDFGHASG